MITDEEVGHKAHLVDFCPLFQSNDGVCVYVCARAQAYALTHLIVKFQRSK